MCTTCIGIDRCRLKPKTKFSNHTLCSISVDANTVCKMTRKLPIEILSTEGINATHQWGDATDTAVVDRTVTFALEKYGRLEGFDKGRITGRA
jgi:hypothetical protein